MGFLRLVKSKKVIWHCWTWRSGAKATRSGEFGRPLKSLKTQFSLYYNDVSNQLVETGICEQLKYSIDGLSVIQFWFDSNDFYISSQQQQILRCVSRRDGCCIQHVSYGVNSNGVKNTFREIIQKYSKIHWYSWTTFWKPNLISFVFLL